MSDQTTTHHAPNQDFRELSGEEGLKKIAELLKGIHIAMINTVASDGSISARPMAVQDKSFDGKLWFLTSVNSEKIDEILQDQHVTLTLASESKFITLKGRASLNQDRARINELWSPMYKAWFPDGQNDPNIAVLRVDVSEAEYWQASSSSLVRSARYLAAAVTGGKTSVGEAGHVLV
ncbi:MAG: pyridoxamine 5'-phosphate oxidase family protein [Acidobacteriaceae bacterium]